MFGGTRPGVRVEAKALVHKCWKMVDHSPRQDGSDWLPGGKRFALTTGESVRRVDEIAFQIS